MRIPHTAIAIDGTTAWLVIDGPRPGEYDDRHEFNRPCDTCKGTHLYHNGIGADACPDCTNGRHTFTLDVQCGDSIHLPFVPDLTDDDPLYVPGDRECSQCDESGTRTITVHVVDVLELVKGPCPDKTNAPHRRAHLHLDDNENQAGMCRENCDLVWDSPWKSRNLVTLPTSAAPGKYAVQIEVHA
jgi:hypothetical protein